MSTLDLTPEELDLRLYVGDDPVLQFTTYADETKTERFNFTGYTGWAARLKAPDGTLASFTVDAADAVDGVVLASLEGDVLRTFPLRGSRWDIRALDPSGREITIARGRITLLEDVTV